jgi:hypothetical protein
MRLTIKFIIAALLLLAAFNGVIAVYVYNLHGYVKDLDARLSVVENEHRLFWAGWELGKYLQEQEAIDSTYVPPGEFK